MDHIVRQIRRIKYLQNQAHCNEYTAEHNTPRPIKHVPFHFITRYWSFLQLEPAPQCWCKPQDPLHKCKSCVFNTRNWLNDVKWEELKVHLKVLCRIFIDHFSRPYMSEKWEFCPTTVTKQPAIHRFQYPLSVQVSSSTYWSLLLANNWTYFLFRITLFLQFHSNQKSPIRNMQWKPNKFTVELGSNFVIDLGG